MEGEFGSFIKVWTSVFVCIFYCYSIGKIVPKGTTRLLCVLPVVCLFFYLPLNFSSIHLGGGTSFFISWLGSFKLLLFAIGKGPLASDPSISIGPNPPKAHLSPSLLVHIPSSRNPTHHCSSPRLGPSGFRPQTPFQRALPLHLSAKLLGQKMNLVVTSILRQSVYEPTLKFSTCVIGRRWASLPAVFASFLVSGLMHELIYYHMGRVRPTWEVTWFFVLHGFCLMVEIVLKKALKGRCRLPRLISVVLTVGFVVATCFWLFFPQFLRCKADVRMLQEYRAFVVFLKNVVGLFSYKRY
ncbi:unnamed protein product [Prunus brigantina]